MIKQKRQVFFISDRTGITAETLGNSLLTQFPEIKFERTFIPFVSDQSSAQRAVKKIKDSAQKASPAPIIFSTITDPAILKVISDCSPFIFDFFGTFIAPLEDAFDCKSSRTAGKMHGIQDTGAYESRLNALNFTLNHDDGLSTNNFHEADIILIGVSRCGKTPTCLYLAMHYSLKAANYPLTSDDFVRDKIPNVLKNNRTKLFGLTIEPEQLSRIRKERRPYGAYATLDTCKKEINLAENIFRNEKLNFLDTSTISIEEIAAIIVQRKGLH